MKTRKETAKFWGTVLMLAFVLSIPVLLGCRYIFLFDNAQCTLFSYLMPERFVWPVGETYHGALRNGVDAWKVYSDLGDATNKMMVYDPVARDYVPVDSANYERAAQIIRDNYIEVHPGNYPSYRTFVTFTGFDGRWPVFEMEVFPLPQGAGTLHTIKILGHAGDGSPTIKIVASDGSTVDYIEPVGRVAVVREGDPGDNYQPEVKNRLENISRTPPGPKVSIGARFTFSTTEELGYVMAVAFPNTIPGNTCTGPGGMTIDCYEGDPVRMRTANVEKSNLVASHPVYTYTLVPVDPLKPGYDYLLAIGSRIQDVPAGYSFIPPAKEQRLTQDMSGLTIIDPLQPLADLGLMTTGDANYIEVIAYFFTTNPNMYGNPDVPAGQKVEAEVAIRPRVLHCNDGVFTALVSFPAGFDITTLADGYCNGAPAWKINYDPDKHYAVLKFNRRDVTSPFSEHIPVECWGHTDNGEVWRGYGTLKRVISCP